MLDLLKPWFGMNVVRFHPFLAAHPRFLVMGTSYGLSFLNWLLPELHARGMRDPSFSTAQATTCCCS